MNNKQMKKATVDAINVMISHADKGPSGFWVEDHEGCGNPWRWYSWYVHHAVDKDLRLQEGSGL